MAGQQIKLFLVDGTPGGLTAAEITNWTGHVLHARRSDLGALLNRAEAQRTGVYLLLADDPTAIGETRCYIGEADVVADRLRHHHRDKEFWDRAVVVTSKDTNLTKSHGRYLEARLIALATRPPGCRWRTAPSHHCRRFPRPTPPTWTSSWRNSRSCSLSWG